MKQREQTANVQPLALSHTSIGSNQDGFTAVQPQLDSGTAVQERLDQIAHQLSGHDGPLEQDSVRQYAHFPPALFDNTVIPETVVARIVREVIWTLAGKTSLASVKSITDAVFNLITTIAAVQHMDRPDVHSLASSVSADHSHCESPGDSDELFTRQYIELEELFLI